MPMATDIQQETPILAKQNNFVIEQYKSLREEVKETKTRIFQLAILGLTGVPSSYFLAENYEQLKVLRLSLPILICTFLFFFLSETRALMRCGQFIKENIEPAIKKSSGIEDNQQRKHWEEWLESGRKILGLRETRLVDVFMAFSFDVLFLIYYWCSVKLAYEAHKNDQWGIVIAVAYSIIGGIVIAFLVWNFKSSTSTNPRENNS